MPADPLESTIIDASRILKKGKEKGKVLGDNARNKVKETIFSSEKIIIYPWQAKAALVMLFVFLLMMGAGLGYAMASEQVADWFYPVMGGLWFLTAIDSLLLLTWLWQEYAKFGNDLFSWASQFRQGDFAQRMPTSNHMCPSYLIRERLNSVADDYQTMAQRLERRLSRQERYIQQKKFNLNVLYDVASGINRSKNLDDLLQRFLLTLKNVLNAEAATVRLLDEDGQMRLVASIGLDEEVAKQEATLPAPECMCGKVADSGEIQIRANIKRCSARIGKPFFDRDDIELIAIPLQYREKTLGIYNLFVSNKSRRFQVEDEHELLMSIGQHLGMAIEKASVDEEAHMLSIMEERTRIAHELHDSLAQTLASLRFKVRLFDDSLNRGEESTIWEELEGLEKGIDDANAELRSLITHFRAPVDGKGIVRTIERIVDRFRVETNLDVFFYHNWSLDELSREIELEAVRIVQESLANVRKHSQAETVRILMYSSEEGECRILVEDDGVGLPENPTEPNYVTGEHFGLTTMRERAERINGEITFESEPDEGTLMQLNFDAITETPSQVRLNDVSIRQYND